MMPIHRTYAYHSALKATSSFIRPFSFPKSESESEALRRDLWAVAGNRYSAALLIHCLYLSMQHICVLIMPLIICYYSLNMDLSHLMPKIPPPAASLVEEEEEDEAPASDPTSHSISSASLPEPITTIITSHSQPVSSLSEVPSVPSSSSSISDTSSSPTKQPISQPLRRWTSRSSNKDTMKLDTNNKSTVTAIIPTVETTPQDRDQELPAALSQVSSDRSTSSTSRSTNNSARPKRWIRPSTPVEITSDKSDSSILVNTSYPTTPTTPTSTAYKRWSRTARSS